MCKKIIYQIAVALFAMGFLQAGFAHYDISVNCNKIYCSKDIGVSSGHPHAITLKCHKPYKFLKSWHAYRHKHIVIDCVSGFKTPYSVGLSCTSLDPHKEHVHIHVHCDDNPCNSIAGIC